MQRGLYVFSTIFLINGSPKGQNSNSLKLSYAFINGIKNKSTEQIEIRESTLSKLNIQSCKGCFACWKSTPGKCCIQDDMEQIIENQPWADLIIFSFPLSLIVEESYKESRAIEIFLFCS